MATMLIIVLHLVTSRFEPGYAFQSPVMSASDCEKKRDKLIVRIRPKIGEEVLITCRRPREEDNGG